MNQIVIVDDYSTYTLLKHFSSYSSQSLCQGTKGTCSKTFQHIYQSDILCVNVGVQANEIHRLVRIITRITLF